MLVSRFLERERDPRDFYSPLRTPHIDAAYIIVETEIVIFNYK